MKYLQIFFLIAFTTLTVLSCVRPEPHMVSFTIDGLKNYELGPGETETTTLTINETDPSLDETVKLSVENLPQGVTASLRPDSGEPGFITELTITVAEGETPGLYPVQLIAESTVRGRKTYDFDIKVKQPPVCGLLKDYMGAFDGLPEFESTVQPRGEIVENAGYHEINITNFGALNHTIAAQVSCNEMRVLIPHQALNADTSLAGEGTFDDAGRLHIQYSFFVSGVMQPGRTFHLIPKAP